MGMPKSVESVTCSQVQFLVTHEIIFEATVMMLALNIPHEMALRRCRYNHTGPRSKAS